MDRLCDEILQLVFYELAEPSPFTQVCQRFYRFSQDPYVRARYFLIHYGHVEAMYYALGRGKVLNERVLEILLSSGAQLSRYLIQVAMHHYFHTQSHFIKTQWVRNVPLRVFAYFLKVAAKRYGDIPCGRGEDDGTIFSTFLKESRVPAQLKSVSWETIKVMMETCKFIPFCQKDPLTPHFPLALAIEPRLLPYAVANGFGMDYKYRDFVFRKMFERSALPAESRVADVANNVRELCKLDPSMFVSRTVAAEVCMEAKFNEIGYNALKELDKSDDLRFALSTLVEDLLRTFLTTRSICSLSTGDVLLYLFSDFPSTDVTVRLVILIVVFISAEDLPMPRQALRTKLDDLGLMPITRRDVFNILVNPFVERCSSLLEFAAEEIREDGSKKGMNDLEDFVAEVAVKCMEISCKGKLVRRLCDVFPHVKNAISYAVLSKHQIALEDLPAWNSEDGRECTRYRAELSRDFIAWGAGDVHTIESLMPPPPNSDLMDTGESESEPLDEPPYLDVSVDQKITTDHNNLGDVTQETLTAMIRHDESVPVRSRRRNLFLYPSLDMPGKMRYPHDALHVAKWAKTQYGPRSPVVAVFMTHAVLNCNHSMLHFYLSPADTTMSLSVPVTLKHFQLLASLGRSPHYYLWRSIELGAEFYFDEDEYLSEAARVMRKSAKRQEIKVEPDLPSSTSSLDASTGSRRRPRRSAAVAIRSYALPDSSDEETFARDVRSNVNHDSRKRIIQETRLQLWIKHLGLLLRVETRKFSDLKKRQEKENPDPKKPQLQKNHFIRTLSSNLRILRKLDSETRSKNFIEHITEEYSGNEDDEEYILKPHKRRKTFHV